jgi:threonyl-tRNA synthetase
VENGFYYDVDLGNYKITEDDLRKLEQKMAELAKQNNVYTRKEVPKPEAVNYFTEKGDEYKLDLLQNLQDGEITFYTQGGLRTVPRPAYSQHRFYKSHQAYQHCRGVLERR